MKDDDLRKTQKSDDDLRKIQKSAFRLSVSIQCCTGAGSSATQVFISKLSSEVDIRANCAFGPSGQKPHKVPTIEQ